MVRCIEKLDEIVDQNESGLRNLIANAKYWIYEIQKVLSEQSQENKS
jgi:hypothetical protein